MIVTCPHCSRRYMLDESLLPQEGRQVRCIACHHVWRQIPDLASHAPHSPFVGEAELALQTGVASARKSSWMIGITFLLLLTLCTATLIFGRNFIVTYWPAGEKYYELAGLQITLPGTGLSIASASVETHQEGSTEMIRVIGNIVNTSDTVRPIPPLKIKLIKSDAEDDGVLDQWEHRLSAQSLLPGEKISFETDPHPKVEGAQHIRVEF